MILNKDIYERAINLIDDPDINEYYATNIIDFQKTMYPFLQNGVSVLTAPPSVCALLAQQEPPEGTTEIIAGTGEATYSLTMPYINSADVAAYINGEVDKGAVYNSAQNSITFSTNVDAGTECSVEFYFAGAFNGDFSEVNGKFPLNYLEERLKDLLARVTVISWADKQKNFLLDIRNLLTDTDFKLHSPASSVKAKMEWVQDLRLEVFNLQNKLDWELRNRNRSYYGY